MSSIFSAQGGYETAKTFVDGLRPALVVGSAMVALAGVAVLLIPSARRAARSETVAEGPVPTLTPAPALETASH